MQFNRRSTRTTETVLFRSGHCQICSLTVVKRLLELREDDCVERFRMRSVTYAAVDLASVRLLDDVQRARVARLRARVENEVLF